MVPRRARPQPPAVQNLDPNLKCSRASLRILGSMGEPNNPEAWLWYHDMRCPCLLVSETCVIKQQKSQPMPCRPG